MHVWFVARQVARLVRSRELTLLGAGLAACAALLLAGCSGASPRPSAPDGAATPPEQVGRPVQSDRTPSSITVSWRAPASDGEITHYELRWRQAGDESWTMVPQVASAERNYAISGLQGVRSTRHRCGRRRPPARGNGPQVSGCPPLPPARWCRANRVACPPGPSAPTVW